MLYCGCWLDINQPGNLLFPSRMVGGVPAILPDGPFTNMGTLFPIQQLVRSQHQCLIAEIAFDRDVIPPGADPSISDKLAQRNLTFVNVPNPGVLASRRAPHTFEIRPTPAGGPVGFPHNELMIDWGDAPAESTGKPLPPAVTAADIIAIANQTNPAHRLTVVGTSTVALPAEGISYVPIPAGQGENLAGLLTVDLPGGIREGESYKHHRQAGHSRAGLQPRVPAGRGECRTGGELGGAAFGTGWRRVIGMFTMTIDVATKHALLPGGERLLSILRWIELVVPVESRWYLVFRRYVDQIAHRVRFMGGDPAVVGPTPDGDWQHLGYGKGPRHEPAGERRLRFEGKVASLIYDRFGDFTGFALDTEERPSADPSRTGSRTRGPRRRGS